MAVTQQFAAGESLTAAKLNTSSIPVVSSTADIASPFTGHLVFNTTDTRLYRYSGTAWIVFTGGPTWALSRITTQTYANNAWTTMNWTVENVDTGNMHPTNGDTVTINQAGLYAINAKASFSGTVTTAGQRACRLTINGTADANAIDGSSVIQNAANAVNITSAVPSPTVYIQLAVNDVIRAQAWQNSGTNPINNSVASIGDYPLFTGTWLRD